MTWGAIGGAAVSVIGGAMLSDSGGGGGGQQQMQQASEADKAAAEISRDQWDRYKSMYLPLEEGYVSEAQGMGSIASQNKAAQQSAADVAGTFAGARERLNETPGGLSGQGRTQEQAKLNLAEAASSAAGQNVARQNVVNTGRAARTDALSLGKGLPAQAQNGLLSSASGLRANGQFGIQQGNATAAGFGKVVGGLASPIEKWINSPSSSSPAGGSTAPGGGSFGSDIGFDDPFGA
jgi:hypothetical protein